MEKITVKDIVTAVNGTLLCGDENHPVEHLSIDSRTMKGNDLFVPLIGEKVDAHRFIEQAFGAGAVAVLTSEHDHAEDAASNILRFSNLIINQPCRFCKRFRIGVPGAPLFFCPFTGLEYLFSPVAPAQDRAVFVRDTD